MSSKDPPASNAPATSDQSTRPVLLSCAASRRVSQQCAVSASPASATYHARDQVPSRTGLLALSIAQVKSCTNANAAIAAPTSAAPGRLAQRPLALAAAARDRKSTRLN